MGRQMCLVGASVGLLTTGLLVTPAPSVGAAACTFESVTSLPSDQALNGVPSDDGTLVAFGSSFNINGANPPPATDEIWLRDSTIPSTVAITNSTNVNGADDPGMSADGTRIIFESAENIGGFNANGNVEIWLHDRSIPTTVPMTLNNAFNGQGSISADGEHIVYRSDDPVLDNEDGNLEIWVLDLSEPDATLDQITDTTGQGASVPSISGDGSHVAFQSRDPIVGPNPGANDEIYLHDRGTGTTEAVTATPTQPSAEPSLDHDGNRLAFSSPAVITGPNPDGNSEIYLYNATAASTSRVTNSVNPPEEGFAAGNLNPSISGDGRRIAFVSPIDLTGQNSDAQNEVFVRDLPRGTTIQLTETTTFSGGPTVSDGGTQIAFHSDGVITGPNPESNNEVYVAHCGSALPVFTDVGARRPFFDEIQWMTALGIADGFPNGTFKPLDPVKRQQMANFLYNLAGEPAFTPPGTPSFTDVPASNPFFLEIEWMVAEEVASGFPNGTFQPAAPVKRQQMANFLYNLAGEPAFAPPATPSFSDVPASNPFFAEIEWMVAEGIANGFPNGTFRPREAVKRQQMASFLFNVAAGVGVGI